MQCSLAVLRKRSAKSCRAWLVLIIQINVVATLLLDMANSAEGRISRHNDALSVTRRSERSVLDGWAIVGSSDADEARPFLKISRATSLGVHDTRIQPSRPPKPLVRPRPKVTSNSRSRADRDTCV